MTAEFCGMRKNFLRDVYYHFTFSQYILEGFSGGCNVFMKLGNSRGGWDQYLLFHGYTDLADIKNIT